MLSPRLCLLALCLVFSVLAQDSVLPAAVEPKPEDNYERFTDLFADDKPTLDAGVDKVAMPDIHLDSGAGSSQNTSSNISLPLTPEALPPTYNFDSNHTNDGFELDHFDHQMENSTTMEATTKKTFIMKIPTSAPTTKSPMMSTTMGMMQDAPAGGDQGSKAPGMMGDMMKSTVAPQVSNSKTTSSQLISANNATMPPSKTMHSGATIISPATLIVVIVSMLGSRLC